MSRPEAAGSQAASQRPTRQPSPPLSGAHLDRAHPDGSQRAALLRVRARDPAGGRAAAAAGGGGPPSADRHPEPLPYPAPTTPYSAGEKRPPADPRPSRQPSQLLSP